jgi:acetoin utilization protein AcuB
MRVRDFMSRNVETIRGEAPADAALARMRTRSIHHLVVLDDAGIAGVLSERDLGGRRAEKLARGLTVTELMSKPVVTVDESATVREAARRLRGRTIGCLPVTQEGRLVGIVTTADLLDLIGRGLEKPVVTTRRWTLRNRGPRRRAGVRRGA